MSTSAPTSEVDLSAALLAPADESLDEETLLAGLFCGVLQTRYNLLNVKAYRLHMPPLGGIPVTPCLSHEAQLHEHDLPHMGSYVQHRETGKILGVVYLPMRRQFIVEEESEEAEAELAELRRFLEGRYPEHDVSMQRLRRGSAFLRARDVAEAHLPLDCVLCGSDEAGVRKHLDRLNGISVLMEKESRVTSWGMRTAYPPFIASIAFLLVLAFPGRWDDISSLTPGSLARLALILAVGGAFLYYGLKAVQLTKTATRLAKRIREYDFILTARKVKQGSCFDTGDIEPLPGFRSESQSRVSELLATLDTDVSRVAWFVTNRIESAQIALGRHSQAKNPLLSEIAALRLDMVEAMSERLNGRMGAFAAADVQPMVVSERADLRRRLAVLDVKRDRLRSYLGLDDPDGEEDAPEPTSAEG